MDASRKRYLSSMVIKPDDCVEGNANFKLELGSIEAKIDAALKKEWYVGRDSIRVYLASSIRYGPEYMNIKRALENAYRQAGWKLSFDGYSDQRDGDAFWVEIKLAT